jgi:hypothetical protein
MIYIRYLTTNFLIGRFLMSSHFTAWKEKYPSFREQHAALNNDDKIGALIQKIQLLSYPEGKHLEG